MRKQDSWRPTQFAYKAGRLSVGPDAAPGSWMVTRLVADAYGRYLPLYARGRLVDLGCGPVPLYDVYRRLADEVVCVDWGGSRHDSRHVDVHHHLNEPLPLPDASFDTALLSDVLEHLSEPQLLLDEVRRILSPSGTLLLNVPFLYWLHEQPHDYFRFTEHALRMMVERAGMRLIVLERLGGGVDVLADLVGKLVQPHP